jgi:hypothetical protein
MTHSLSIDDFSAAIKKLYDSDPPGAEILVESYLGEVLKQIPPAEKVAALEDLCRRFEPPDTFAPSEEISRLFSILLGDRISASDLRSGEINQKFASSLNTIFDTLNQVIAVIQTTLLGRRETDLETIRQVIGSSLVKEGRPESLQSYLDQIREAFLVAHRAFQQAAESKMKWVLSEMDPQKMESESTGGGLKFGPFLKADLFESHKEKFKKFKAWVESGRFREELLREFERNCQKSYRSKAGNSL